MDKFEITLVRSKIKSRPYCKVDGVYAGPTWKNDIGLQSVPYNIESVFQLCQQLSGNPTTCMVYGSAVRPKLTNTDRTMANFEEKPTYLLTLDLDNYEGGLKDAYPTYREAVKEADAFVRAYLPPEFSNVSYVLRFSSSFLFTNRKFKCHILFLLENSQYPREIGTWLKRENIQADSTFYFNLTQPIFTAQPTFVDKVDPLRKIDGYFPRVSLVKKEKDLVPEGWQPYSVPAKQKLDLSNIPDAGRLPGRIGSFCRMMPIDKALVELGYERQDDDRFLSPSSQTGLAGVIIFSNGYCYTHHSDDPISVISDKMYGGKRSSFNSHDLIYGWAKINRDELPDLMGQFEFVMAEAVIADQAYQDEVVAEFIFRTEWLVEDGYTGDNKVIVDSLMYDLSKSGLNEMSRGYIFDMVNTKSAKKIKRTELNNAWKALRKDSAYYKNVYDPDAGLRHMAQIFMQKQLVYSHHGGLRGDFWCYYGHKRLWKRLNRDQTDAYIYKHLHEALPIKKEIALHKVDDLSRLILKLICEGFRRFRPGKGWAFKGGKIGILMNDLFKEDWKIESNIKTLKREHKISKELPVTYDQWKQSSSMPNDFNDFLVSSCEEDYEKVSLFQEFMGYIFADSYYLHNFMVLEGVPGSGKSILIKIIRAALGPRFFTAISLNRMGTQFGLGELPEKKLAVMSEAREINFNQLRAAVPVILKMVGNDPMDIEAKHKMSTTEVLDCKLMVVTNRTPVMPDDTGALTQRMIMVRLHKSFRGTDEEILGLDESIMANEIPAIIKWSLKGLEDLVTRKRFHIPKSVLDESIYYREQLDPLKIFIEEFFRFEKGGPTTEWIPSTKFIDHFHEYLFRIGQVFERSKIVRRASIPVLRSLDKRISRTQVRNGSHTYAAIEPLVPNRDLELEFISERSEIAQTVTRNSPERG
jgi:P4 family phage/plasmid primase-like protien